MRLFSPEWDERNRSKPEHWYYVIDMHIGLLKHYVKLFDLWDRTGAASHNGEIEKMISTKAPNLWYLFLWPLLNECLRFGCFVYYSWFHLEVSYYLGILVDNKNPDSELFREEWFETAKELSRMPMPIYPMKQ